MPKVISKSNTTTFWLMTFASSFFLLLIVSIVSQYYFGFEIVRMRNINSFRQMLANFILCSLPFLFFVSQIWRDAKLITIDTELKTICFRNRFSRIARQYDFDYFQGYVACYQSSKLGSKRVLYLINDEKYFRKISAFYYSNLGDLENSLTPMKYYGQQHFGILKSFRILFGMRIEIVETSAYRKLNK